MFFDNVVIAGVLTVGLMVLFFAGFGFFIWKDSHKRKTVGLSGCNEHARHFGQLRLPFFLSAVFRCTYPFCGNGRLWFRPYGESLFVKRHKK